MLALSPQPLIFFLTQKYLYFCLLLCTQRSRYSINEQCCGSPRPYYKTQDQHCSGLRWKDPTYCVMLTTFCQRRHVTNGKPYICPSTALMTTEPSRLRTQGEGTLRQQVTRPFDKVNVNDNVMKILLHKRKALHPLFYNTYCHQAWQGRDSMWANPPTKSSNLLITQSRDK